VRLTIHWDDGSARERERTFLFPIAEEERVVRTLGQLLDGLEWQAAATGVAVSLAQIQDAVVEQLSLFPLQDEALQDERKAKLQEVERYLVARFGISPFGASSLGGHRLRRPVLAQPGAPLPEWRIGWQSGDER
jgi:hypothetical protein